MNTEPNQVDNNVNASNPNPVEQPNLVNNDVATPNPVTQPEQSNPVNNNFVDSNQNNQNKQPEFNEEPKSKNNTLLVIIIAVLLVGLAVGAYLFFSQRKLSATETIATSTNKQIRKFSQLISDFKSIDVLKDVVATKGTAKIHMELNSTNPVLAPISGLKIDLNGGYDSEKKLFALYSDIKDKDNNEINLKLNGDDTNLFINFGDIFPDTLYTPLDALQLDSMLENVTVTQSSSGNFDEDDIAYLAELVVNAATESIKEADLVKENVKKNIYGEDLSLTKISYELTKERFDVLYDAILTKIKGDQNALEIFVKNDSEKRTVEQWKTYIDELIVENNSYSTFSENVNLAFYVNSKPELVAAEIVTEEGTTYFTAYKEKYTLKYQSKTLESDKFEISYDDKENDVIRLILAGANGDVDVTVTIDDKSTKDIAKADITINVVLGSGEDKANFDIILNYEISETYNFQTPYVANAKNFNYLTEAESNAIISNLKNKPFIGPLIEGAFQGTSGY